MTQQQHIANSRRSLLVFASRHGVTKACKVFNVSRTMYYRLKKQLIETGSLEYRTRRRPRMPNETSLSKKKMLLDFIRKHPTRGPSFYAYLFKQQGISIAPSCIWYHLKRYGLHKRYQRLVYLEQLRESNQPLSERSLQIIKRRCYKAKEALWPGHIIGLDTFYVGHIKGVGRIYQQTGIDLCSRYGWANVYTAKDHIASINFVEKILIPKFFVNGIDLDSILTDNGSEYVNSHFKRMLGDYDIKHHRIPKGKPLFNGYCERFQRTIHEEFYQRIFRTRFFTSLEQLQQALDEYLVYYNFERPHFGIIKSGALPIDVFKAKRSFLRQRFSKIVNLTSE
jgi:transposase InsO family protein